MVNIRKKAVKTRRYCQIALKNFPLWFPWSLITNLLSDCKNSKWRTFSINNERIGLKTFWSLKWTGAEVRMKNRVRSLYCLINIHSLLHALKYVGHTTWDSQPKFRYCRNNFLASFQMQAQVKRDIILCSRELFIDPGHSFASTPGSTWFCSYHARRDTSH